MGKILFWNTAGAGTGAEGEELAPTLTAYTSGQDPESDCVVVCEMRKVSRATKQGFEFRDYVYVKPGRPQQTIPKVPFYHSDNDKRLYVYSKNPGTKVWQLTTGKSRPSVLLLVETKYILVMHAPSVTTTSGPQANEMIDAYELAAQQIAPPVAIFGDLNVDLKSPKRLASLTTYIGNHALSKWNRIGNGTFTHNSKSELDWALCDPKFTAKVKVANVPNKRRKMEEDQEWDGSSEFANKHSDHVPVVLTW